MIKKNSSISMQDLVCDHIYEKYGESSREFFDSSLMEIIKVIRDKVFPKFHILVNSYAGDNNYRDREYWQMGLFCNLCSRVYSATNDEIVAVSDHLLGKAIDLQVYDPTDGARIQDEYVFKQLASNTNLDGYSYYVGLINDQYVHLGVSGMKIPDGMFDKVEDKRENGK